MSLPAWECGLKFFDNYTITINDHVTPCVGVWIEITVTVVDPSPAFVTPCVGVWIEIGRHGLKY